MKKKFTLIAFISMLMMWGIMSSCFVMAQEPGSREYEIMKASGEFPIPEQVPASLGPITTLPQDGSGNRTTYFFELDGTYSSFAGNDDGSLTLTIPFSFCFYGTNYTTVYLNNNGNVSFGTSYGTFSSTGFPSTEYVMIAPFWADVDTRSGNLTRYKIEDHRLIVTWDQVCYFSGGCDLLNSFQLVLTDGTDATIGLGNNVGFAYNDMQWTTGGASGGSGGFGGTPATVGINLGDGSIYALIGRFDHAGSDYDGPGGLADGISYLDNSRYTFSTCNATNSPPSAVGFPGSYVEVTVGDTWTLNPSFLPPEVGQSVSAVITAATLPGLSSSFTPGNPCNISLSLTPTGSDVGTHFIECVGTDNGSPTGITTQYIELHILASTSSTQTQIENPSNMSCTGFDVDITVQNFENVGAISLVLNFDPAVLEYNGVTLNPAIASATADVYVDGQFILSYSDVGVTLNDNDVLFTLHMDYENVCFGTDGSTSLIWSTQLGDCEYAGPGGSPIYVTSFFDVTFDILGDEVDPVITCPNDITINCDDPQDPANTGGFATATDNCTDDPDIEITYDDNIVPGNCADNYVIERTWTAEDDCGNTLDCLQEITVRDVTDPVLKNGAVDCSSLNISGVNECMSAAATWDATTLYASVEALYEDNCDTDLDVILINTVPDAGNDDCDWLFTYTYEIEDNCGNTVECDVTRSGSDQEDPEITCATPAASYNTDAGVCSYTVPGIGLDPVFTDDNCGIYSVVNDYNNSGTLEDAVFNLGPTTVIWTITDNCGLTETCSYIVNVVDNQAPVPVSNDDETVECVADAVAPTVPQANDYCDGLINGVLYSIVDTPDPLTCLGNRVYTYSYTDEADNTSYWSYTYYIVRTIAPTVPAAGSSTVECPADAVPPLQKPEQDQFVNTPTEFMELNNSCGQSFNCGSTGMLTKIDIHIHTLAAPQTGLTVKVFQGNGILGTEIYSGAGYAITSTGWQTLDIPDNLAPILTSGNQYTFWLEGYTYDALKASLGYVAPGGPYALGEAWDFPILANYPDHDMVFRTYVEPVVVDYCGVQVFPSTPVISGTNSGCEGTIIYTYTYTDCAGLSTDWVYTYNVEYEDFAITVPAGGSTVDCPADTDQDPTPPTIYDNCGVELIPEITDVDPKPECEGTRTYTFTYTDCEGNDHDWTYTYTVVYEDFVITDAPGGSMVACPVDTDVEPTPPLVFDNCGIELLPVLSGVDPKPSCEGTRTYTFTYTDCSGFHHDWTYTYTIDYVDFSIIPASGGSTVECPDNTDVVPTPPVVADHCGVSILPTGPVVSAKPACEGDRTYTWTYTDCSGFTHDWVYTYTVDRTINPVVPEPEGSTVACASEAIPPIQAPDVDQFNYDPDEYLELNTSFGQSFTCGEPGKLVKIDVHLTKLDYPQSGLTLKVYKGDGIGTLIYSGTGYALNSTGWQTLDIPDNLAPVLVVGTKYTFWLEGYAFNTVWASLGYFYTGGPYTGGKAWDFPVLANYPDHDMVFVTYMEPIIHDYCGAVIPTPSPVISGDYDGCEGTIVYTYTYTDCANLSTDWVYTYTVEVEDFISNMPSNNGSQVACVAEAVQPTPPDVDDYCGTPIIPTGPVTGGDYDGCEGTVTYTWNYEDCEGNNHDWTYTYTVELEDFTMPSNVGSQIACSDEAIQPTPPIVNDYCGNPITPTGPITGGDYEGCEGTITFTWNYEDCEGNNHDWTYTYTVEVEDFTMPSNDGSQIACAFDAIQPTPPDVDNYCGNPITPTGPVTGGNYDGCEGTITFTWNYEDCEGNDHDWTYTYTVEVEPFNNPVDEGDIIACVAEAVTPQLPLVTDYCGNTLNPIGPPDVSAAPDCEGLITYLYTYRDCEGNEQNWLFTYEIEYEDFDMPSNQGTQIACAINAVQPTPPVVDDYCDKPIIPTGPVTGGDYDGCEGTITYTWNYEDCEGNNHDWVYTYTVELEDFYMPSNDGSQVACAYNAVQPTPPAVNDYCGNAITPTGPLTSGDYDGCEGTIIFTWNYEDCEGNNHDWIYTYTVEVEDFIANMPSNNGSQVACAVEAVQPTPPDVVDYCGTPIIPTGPVTGGNYNGCEGTISYTWNYEDCEGNNHDWTYTYTVEVEDFTMPSNDGSQIACAINAVQPTPPDVDDYCGNAIIPTGPVSGGNYNGCEGTITYTWNYEDCEGNNHDWTYTYTVEVEDFTMPSNDGSQIACAFDAIQPTPPDVVDYCGNPITPTGPVPGGDYNGCEGTVSFTWNYEDCEGNDHDWTYTYTVEVEPFNKPVDEGDIIACVGEAFAPELPLVTDYCGNTLNPIGPPDVSAAPDCEGLITYLYTYRDCEGNEQNWLFTYEIEYKDFDMPSNDGTQIACAIDAVQPTPPDVDDYCEKPIIPTGPVTGGDYDGCEGTITYTWNYEDCEGNNHDWVYTYTVELEPFSNPVDDGDVVACAYDAVPPALPLVTDYCGNILDPIGVPVVSAAPDCEGFITYLYTYRDCEGNEQNWLFTYEIEYDDFDMPSNDGTQIACVIDAVQPTPPVVDDYCGKPIIPTGPVTGGNYDGCEGTISYTWNYEDCEGNNHDWVYTYTVELEPFSNPVDNGTIVACIDEVVAPTLPLVTDYCGNTLNPIGAPHVSPAPDCEGFITYLYTYRDCEGNEQNWLFTYEIEYLDFTMPSNEGTQIACAINAVQPTPPDVDDYCGNPIIPTGPVTGGDYDGCEGTITFTWNYEDCEGNNHDWVYTYTVEVEDFVANMPSNDGSQVACTANAVQPTPPNVNDNCGNPIIPTGPLTSGDYDGCEGTIIFTWNYEDCEGNNHDWAYTYTVELEDFNMPSNDGAQIACAISAVQPTPPVVVDYCGNPIVATGPVTSGDYDGCEGTIIFTWNYQDCEGNNHDWVYTYSVEVEPFNNPVDDGDVVACADDAVPPTLPLVTDYCGNTLNPIGPPDVSPAPDCEGFITYLYTYRDCEGNEQNWIFVYEIEYQDFTMPSNDGSQVACAAAAVQPTPPSVNDNCGKPIIPTGPVPGGDYDGCEGTITYTWNYEDCEGNNHDWTYTYTVEVEDFNMPSNDGSQVACAANAVQPTPPVVNDNCLNPIIPTGPVPGGDYDGCEGTITYTWNYEDCEGNNHDWVYTYTVEVEDFTMPSNEGTQIACAIQAIEPTPPVVEDYCGNTITPTGPVPGGDYDGCEGTITFTWNYEDCEGNNYDWVYTYTVEVEDFVANMPSNGSTTIDCVADAVQPTPPEVDDYCGNTIIPTGPVTGGNYNGCEGTYTYTWNYADCEGNNHDWTYTYNVTRGELTGKLMYYNTPKTPMNNVTLTILETSATSITDGLGNYSFPNLCPGTYTIRITDINKPVGYINSSDAAAVNSWFAGQIPIEHVKWNAGDVNWFYDANSTDAKAIQNYFVYPGNPLYSFDRGPWTFWKAGSLVNNNSGVYPEINDDDFTVEICGNTVVNIYGMGVGDFNGSFVPGGLKNGNESLNLVYNETRKADADMEVELPVTVKNTSIVGAVSLILYFPAEHMSVTGVTMSDSKGQIDWSAVGNELRIGWHTLQPVWIGANETLLTIKIRTAESFSQGDVINISLANDPLCEIADGSFNTIPDAVLGIDALEFSTYGIVDPSENSGLTLECRPNPFATYTTLTYTLPADGHVTLQITDMLGRKVAVLTDEFQANGKYSFKLDALPLQAGVYNAQLILHNSSGDLIKILKLVRNQ